MDCSKICYICKNNKNLSNITKERSGNDLIVGKLAACVPEVEWSRIESLHVCKQCLQKVEWMYDFKQACIKSHDIHKQDVPPLKGKGRRKLSTPELHLDLQESVADNRQQPLSPQPSTSSYQPQPTNTDIIHNANFDCEICSRGIFQRKLLQEHCDNIHDGVFPYSCRQCSSPAEKEIAPYQVQEHIIGTYWICEICFEDFTSEENLMKHDCKFYDGIIEKGNFRKGKKCAQCNICKTWFSTKYYLKRHLKSHGVKNIPTSTDPEDASDDVTEGENSNPANKKAQIMLTETDYFHEFIVKLPNRKFACTFCRSEYGLMCTALKHIHCVHLRNTSYHCHICGEIFLKLYKFTLHLRSHYVSLACSECKEIYTDISTVARHMKTAHRELNKIDCKICDMSFDGNGIQLLRDHVEVHQLDISYRCHMCEQTFKETRDFINHLLEENGMKLCKDCDQVYNEALHPNHQAKCERGKFICSFCTRAYHMKIYLDTHLVAVHSGEACTSES